VSVEDRLETYRHEFDSCMELCPDYSNTKQLVEWQSLRERYACFRSRSVADQSIPRILHQIWCGGELPAHYRKFMRCMQRVNPDMEYRFWDGKSLDFEPVTGDLLQRARNPGQKSDILRFEILNRHGGIYADMDFMAVRPFAPLLKADFFTGIVFHSEPSLMNGLVGSAPGHPITREILGRVKISEDPSAFDDIMRTTGPFLMTEVFMALYHEHPQSVALPIDYFCPFPNFPVLRTRGENYRKYIAPQTICVHLWHCSWMKRAPATRSGLRQRLRAMFHG